MQWNAASSAAADRARRRGLARRVEAQDDVRARNVPRVKPQIVRPRDAKRQVRVALGERPTNARASSASDTRADRAAAFLRLGAAFAALSLRRSSASTTHAQFVERLGNGAIDFPRERLGRAFFAVELREPALRVRALTDGLAVALEDRRSVAFRVEFRIERDRNVRALGGTKEVARGGYLGGVRVEQFAPGAQTLQVGLARLVGSRARRARRPAPHAAWPPAHGTPRAAR